MRSARRWWMRLQATRLSARSRTRRPWPRVPRPQRAQPVSGGPFLASPASTPAVPRLAWQVLLAALLVGAVWTGARLPAAWSQPVIGIVQAHLVQDSLAGWRREAAAAMAWTATRLPLATEDNGRASASGLPVRGDATTPLPTGLGTLTMPIGGEVVGWFGFREVNGQPIYHTGLDLAAPAGTAVVAAAAGTVASTGPAPNAQGQQVLVQHADGWSTLYRHLGHVAVASGAKVTAGQRLGALGSGADSGMGTTPALHFELRDDGHPVDPAPYFGLLAPNGS